MRGRIVAVSLMLVVSFVLSGCANAERPRAATDGSVTSSAPPAESRTASATSTTNTGVGDRTYDGLMRVFAVSRDCGSTARVSVQFKAVGLPASARMRMTSSAGTTYVSSTHHPLVVERASGDGVPLLRGDRSTWELSPAGGPIAGTAVSSDWTVTIVSVTGGHEYVHPDAVVLPSCAERTWRAPGITLAISQIRRDCSKRNDFSARVQAAGLVYELEYDLDGTAQGYEVNMLEPYSTTYDAVQHLTPMPDLRPSTTPSRPKPFPRAAFTARVRLHTQTSDWFSTDESSAYVTVHVPAC